MRKRHAAWVDIANSAAKGSYGWSDSIETDLELFNAPHRTSDTTINDRQQTILLTGILKALLDSISETKGLRRAIDRLPSKMEEGRLRAQLKLAEKERRAAEARERAARAEFDAKYAEPPVVYQCDASELEQLAPRIRRLL
jgi:hypothetical protein